MLNLEVNTHTFDGVKRQARNRWNELLVAAGIDARALRNDHGPCPGCGGKDRFRYDDKDGDGTFICSQGNGNTLAGDGFELLQHVGFAQSSQEALHLVAGLLGGANSSATKLETEFVYRRPDGTANLKVIRTDTSDGIKTFKQLLPDGKPPKTDPDFRPFPYRIDEWPLDQPILICEGEKCADALWLAGFPATTRAGGSSTWEPELNEHFANRNVIILPDNDDAGRSFAKKVGDALSDAAASIHICELPNLPRKGDIVDWIDAGGQTEELEKTLAKAVPFEDWVDRPKRFKGLRSLREVQEKTIVVREQLHDLLPTGFTLLCGAPKVGKSKLAEFISRKVAETHEVLFLALEYNDIVAKQRFGHMDSGLKLTLCLEGDLQRWDQGGEFEVEDALQQLRPSLTVIDVIGRLKKPGDAKGYEAETESLSAIKRMMSKYGSDCLAVHHIRKASLIDNPDDPFERILGSTAFAAVPDNLQILLQSDQDAVLHTKGRVIFPSKRSLRLVGNDFEEITSALTDLPQNATAQREIIHLLASEGEMSVGAIAKILSKSQSQVTVACQKLAENKGIIRLQNGNYALSDGDPF